MNDLHLCISRIHIGCCFLLGIAANFITYFIFWPKRFFFDDEWFNLKLASSFNLSSIITYISSSDVHPPLSYIINHLTYQITGAQEFLLSVPSLIFSGISLGLAGIMVFSITQRKWMSFITIILISIHPNILLFSWPIRWYALWTMCSMLAIYCTIRLINDSKVNWQIVLLFILSCTAALYTNYQAFLLVISIFLYTGLRILKRMQVKKWPKEYIIIMGVIVTLVLCLPWMKVILRQISNFSASNQLLTIKFYQTSSAVFYGLYCIFTGIFGAAIYPWNWQFIVLFSLLIIAIVLIVIIKMINKDTISVLLGLQKVDQKLGQLIALTSILWLFFIIHSILAASHKARGIALLSVLAVIILSSLIHSVITDWRATEYRAGRKIKTALQSTALICMFAIPLAGTVNVYFKKHLHKMGVSDPVYETLKLILDYSANTTETTYITCIHPALSYYLLENEASANLIVFTPYREAAPDFVKSKMRIVDWNCLDSPKNLVIIESFLGPFLPMQGQYQETLRLIFANSHQKEAQIEMGKDEDYKYKKRLFRSSEISPWRIKISFLTPKAGFNPQVLSRINLMSEIWRK